MLFGYSPFRSKDGNNRQNNIIKNIKEAKYSFPEHIKVSDEAKDLIRKLLTLQPQKRLGFGGAKEIMDHSFFKSISWDDLLNKKLEAPIKVKMPSRKRREVSL